MWIPTWPPVGRLSAVLAIETLWDPQVPTLLLRNDVLAVGIGVGLDAAPAVPAVLRSGIHGLLGCHDEPTPLLNDRS